MNKSKTILLPLLLLIIALCMYYMGCYKKNKTTQVNYTPQGTTIIKQGDIQLKIWDNNTEDGDSVKVYLDGKLIKDTLAILYEPLQLNFGKLSKGEHLLGVVAINEGIMSPASASMSISNQTENKEFEMNATKDSAASWKIIIE